MQSKMTKLNGRIFSRSKVYTLFSASLADFIFFRTLSIIFPLLLFSLVVSRISLLSKNATTLLSLIANQVPRVSSSKHP